MSIITIKEQLTKAIEFKATLTQCMLNARTIEGVQRIRGDIHAVNLEICEYECALLREVTP
jgi:hypothetical protein